MWDLGPGGLKFVGFRANFALGSRGLGVSGFRV